MINNKIINKIKKIPLLMLGIILAVKNTIYAILLPPDYEGSIESEPVHNIIPEPKLITFGNFFYYIIIPIILIVILIPFWKKSTFEKSTLKKIIITIMFIIIILCLQFLVSGTINLFIK